MESLSLLLNTNTHTHTHTHTSHHNTHRLQRHSHSRDTHIWTEVSDNDIIVPEHRAMQIEMICVPTRRSPTSVTITVISCCGGWPVLTVHKLRSSKISRQAFFWALKRVSSQFPLKSNSCHDIIVIECTHPHILFYCLFPPFLFAVNIGLTVNSYRH